MFDIEPAVVQKNNRGELSVLVKLSPQKLTSVVEAHNFIVRPVIPLLFSSRQLSILSAGGCSKMLSACLSVSPNYYIYRGFLPAFTENKGLADIPKLDLRQSAYTSNN